MQTKDQEAESFCSLVNRANLVVLDFDGVIADSEVISISTLQKSMQNFRIHLNLDETRSAFLGKSLRSIFRYVREHGTGNTDAFADYWERQLFTQFHLKLEPVAGIVDLIENLKDKGIPFCIASSGTFRRIGIALDAMGLTDLFPHIFSAEQVAQGKPAPDIFQLAAREMGIAPETCLVIEDSPFGVVAAKAAGMDCVGFLGGQHLSDIKQEHGNLLLNEGADTILSSYDQLSF